MKDFPTAQVAPPKGVAKKQARPGVRDFSKLSISDVTLNIGDVAIINEYYDDKCFGTVERIY